MNPALLFCLLLGQGVLSYELHIYNASELIEFSKNVNSGSDYSGATVFLDADIDFSGSLSKQFEPIGKNYDFQETFDEQGHTISNLAMNSSSQFVGLFGYSKGATIKNVVLDSSCSVENSYSGSDGVHVGGIIGHCISDNRPCVIENNVNMASVSFTGNTTGSTGSLYFGGIIGYLSASNKEVTAKNCANYGSVTHSGTVSTYAYIGGIVGDSSEGSTNKVFIQNCFNYGTINHNGTTSNILYIGGILGCAWTGTNNIENCVSGGKIIPDKRYKGSIVGYVNSGTAITHCYWTSDVGNYNVYGYGNQQLTMRHHLFPSTQQQ